MSYFYLKSYLLADSESSAYTALFYRVCFYGVISKKHILVIWYFMRHNLLDKWRIINKPYVTLEHKTSHKGQFYVQFNFKGH